MTFRSHSRPKPDPTAAQATPWWRIGMVWLVIGGPAVVVVAAIGTAVVAVRGADIVLTDLPAAMTPGHTSPSAATPAHQARNHAATAEAR
jgi:uncharacterized protein